MLVRLLCTDGGVYYYQKLNQNMAALSAADEEVCPYTASVLAIGEATYAVAPALCVRENGLASALSQPRPWVGLYQGSCYACPMPEASAYGSHCTAP